jgi:hypothetical protein
VNKFARHSYSSRPWRLGALRRRAVTRWLLTLALLLMLGQQAVLAAYACAVPPGAMGQMTALSPQASMKAMHRSCPEMRGQTDQLLCQKHCAPDHTAQPDVRLPSVPQNLLTALPPMPSAAVIAVSSVEHARDRRHRLRPSPLADTRLFCSLQI